MDAVKKKPDEYVIEYARGSSLGEPTGREVSGCEGHRRLGRGRDIRQTVIFLNGGLRDIVFWKRKKAGQSEGTRRGFIGRSGYKREEGKRE
jgi:hypothetical protein